VSDGHDHSFKEIERTFKRAVAALREGEIPFLIGGTLASWARGGPEPRKDLDVMVKPEDAPRALAALAGIGMVPERSEEDWLLKARDGGVLVDIIHRPKGMTIDDSVLDRGEELDLMAMSVRVMALEDVLVSKLLALSDHELDLESALQIARSVREQIDWDDVAARTTESPYARSFLTLVEELGVARRATPAEGRARVRVLS
jgi:predicted nucleotidyltransferase